MHFDSCAEPASCGYIIRNNYLKYIFLFRDTVDVHLLFISAHTVSLLCVTNFSMKTIVLRSL